jgi:hypothetical protein
MPKFLAKPVEVLAEQVNYKLGDDIEAEARRLRRVLSAPRDIQIGDDLAGHIVVNGAGSGEDARNSDWIVRLPGGDLIVLRDHRFRLFFAPVAEVPTPD